MTIFTHFDYTCTFTSTYAMLKCQQTKRKTKILYIFLFLAALFCKSILKQTNKQTNENEPKTIYRP